jgi:hypothetical protein
MFFVYWFTLLSVRVGVLVQYKWQLYDYKYCISDALNYWCLKIGYCSSTTGQQNCSPGIEDSGTLPIKFYRDRDLSIPPNLRRLAFTILLRIRQWLFHRQLSLIILLLLFSLLFVATRDTMKFLSAAVALLTSCDLCTRRFPKRYVVVDHSLTVEVKMITIFADRKIINYYVQDLPLYASCSSS